MPKAKSILDAEPFLFRYSSDGEEYVTIVTKTSVFRGADAATSWRRLDGHYLDSLRSSGYSELEDGVFKSPYMTVIIVGKDAYEMREAYRMTHKSFWEELNPRKR